MSDSNNNISAAAVAAPETKKRKSASMDFLFRSVNVAVPKTGDLIDGKVIAKQGQQVFIDLHAFGTGVIYGREFINARDIIKRLKPGDAVSAKVVELENKDGYVELSLCDARQDLVWNEATELLASRTPVTLRVSGANKGGLVIEWKGVQGFLPTSQLRANHYPRVDGGDKEKILSELKKLVGTELSVTVITANAKDGKLIFSEKHTESEELKELVGKYKVGDVIEGPVTGVVDFGIFIKLQEGLEGLAHISELDWSLVENPGDLFHVGDVVKAKVIGIEGGRVSLSLKALTPDPWTEVKDKYKKGDILEAEVLRFNPYGALVCVVKGVCGLVHISEFKSEEDMRSKLTIGQKIPFQIMVFEPAEHKLTFSFLQESVDVPGKGEAKKSTE